MNYRRTDMVIPESLLSGKELQERSCHEKQDSRQCILFTGTILVLSFCGILLSWHIIHKGYKNIPQDTNDVTANKTKLASLQSRQCAAVCASKDCIKTAALTLKMMDPAISPCDDFYAYACGCYDKVVIGNKRKEFIINDISEEILKPLKIMIESLPKSVPENTPGESFAKVRKFYDSCMDLRASEEMAVPTALRYLEYFGIRNWPKLGHDYSFRDPDLNEVLLRLTLYHTFVFFTLKQFDDDDDDDADRPVSTASLQQVSRNEFKIKVSFLYSQIFHVEGYVPVETKKIINATMEHFRLSENNSNEILEDVMSFDLAVYNVTQETSLRQEQCQVNDAVKCSMYYFECREEENDEESRYVNRWCRIVQKLLRECDFTKKYANVRIVLEDAKHFHDLGHLIDHTSHRTIAHALALRFFVDNAIAMNYYLRRRASWANVFPKPPEELPESPSLYCTAWVSRRLPILTGTAFYTNLYRSEIHEEVKEIYSDIQESLLSIVRDMPWVDNELKASVKKKLSSITLSGYAYAQYVGNVTETDEFARKLHITEESFLANDLEAKRFSIVTAIKTLDNITAMEFQTIYPFEFNPTIGEHAINFEIGAFLFPLIAAGRSRYSNLGFFGAILGHELSHALENSLSGYENKSENFEREFEKRKNCLSDHYSKYEIDFIGEKVDGNHTFGENFADYFGFRAIFKSLLRYQEKREFLERLPGLSFDNEQILLVTFAQLWCETNTEESLKHYMKDNHSPAKLRVCRVYKNFGRFSEVFGCPLGSTMNPIIKCKFEF